LWRTGSGEPVLRLLHPGSVNQLAWSPDDRALLTGCEDGQVRLWDVATGRLLGRPQAHHGDIRRIAFSATGQLASGGVDNKIHLWPVPLPWTDSAIVIQRSIQQV